MRTAAARLGLGFAAAMASQKISLSMRRFSTSLAAAATADAWGKKDMQLNENKSLYLCFSELSRCGGEGYVNQVVRSIRMSSDDDYDGEEQYLQVAAYKRSKITTGWSFSACFGSQILYPFGPDFNYVTRIRSMNTATRPLKFQHKSIAFSRPKVNPVLGELNGKLYCVDNVLTTGNIKPGPPFEVLDPENDLKWRPLEAPPFIQSCETVKDNFFYASFLEGSNKILGWDRHQPPVFCFDATKPENGWTESSFSLGNTLPSLCDSIRSPVFIHNHHPCLGDFHLMFNYDFLNAPLLVTAYFRKSDDTKTDSVYLTGAYLL